MATVNRSIFYLYNGEQELGVGRSIRGELGRWISPTEAGILTRHQQIVDDMRAQVLRTIEGELKRPTVSTGRLLRVTASPENRLASVASVGLGNRKFLDNSMAKYWRTIEEGSAETWKKRKFTTLPLEGFWGATLGEWQSGTKGPWVRYAATPKGRPQVPAKSGGKYSPFRGIGLPVFHPKTDIQPMRAYAQAAVRVNLRAQAIKTARDYVEGILGRAFHAESQYNAKFVGPSAKFDPTPLHILSAGSPYAR